MFDTYDSQFVVDPSGQGAALEASLEKDVNDLLESSFFTGSTT
jgi:hypothetical protein